VEVAELLRTPFPLPDQTQFPDQAKMVVKTIAKKVDAFSRRTVAILEDRKQLVRELQAECDALVYDYFGIGDVERALIEDTVSICMQSILPPRASANLPTLRESSSAYRKQYTDLLCETLNDWTQGGAYRISAQVQSSSGSGMAAVVLNRIKSGVPFVESANLELDGLLALLSRLQKTFATDIGSVELLRGVKVFDGDSLYLFKSLDQRFWTRTAALNDADQIATTVLLRSRRERHG
jgi:hypothetical protein